MDADYVRIGVTIVNAAWIAQLGPSLCAFSKPIRVPPTMRDIGPDEELVIPKFGPGWELPILRRKKVLSAT